MITINEQNVLEAIAHSLEFEVYSIETSDGRETIHGLNWDRLVAITGLSQQDLEISTIRLAAAGLIGCGGASHSVFDWLLGHRPAAFFWATPEGHRLIHGRNHDIDRLEQSTRPEPRKAK